MSSIAEITNRFSSILGDSLTKQLCFWLRNRLEEIAGNGWWESNVVKTLAGGMKKEFQKGKHKTLDDFDLNGLLAVFKSNFRVLKEACNFDEEQSRLIDDMRRIRHRISGHRPAGDHAPQVLFVFIETTLKFAEIVNLESSAKIELESLKQKTANIQTKQTNRPKRRIPANIEDFVHCFDRNKLTVSQKDCVNKISDFLNDFNSHCFVLKGYAGTGKTFLIDGLIRYLNKLNIMTVLLAPTGRAALILKNTTNRDSSTIHRHIYRFDQIQEYREAEADGDITFKFYFDLRENQLEHDAVFIVDEASMISDVHLESEFQHFGSGRLLTDLLDYIDFDANDNLKKIILVGDSAQLPPVGMKLSPALDTEHLLNHGLVSSQQYEITNVVRQKGESLILQNATKIRDLIRSGIYSELDFISNCDEVNEVSNEEFIPHYLDLIKNQMDQGIIITYSNRKASQYNKTIRSHLFPKQISIAKGDRVMIQKNNYLYQIELFNGQIGKVINANPSTRIRKVSWRSEKTTKEQKQTRTVSLIFREVEIEFTDKQGPRRIHCQILENVLEDDKNQDLSNLQKALYINFKQRNPNLKPGSDEFQSTLRSDPYFNALQIKYAYAVTCHKAQGGEWPYVFVDFSDCNKLHDGDLRWMYTAITRATKKLFTLNAPHHKLIPTSAHEDDKKNRLPKPIDLSKETNKQDADEIPTALKGRSDLAKNCFKLIKKKINSKYQLILCKESAHLIQFKFKNSHEIKIHYKATNRISRVGPSPEFPDDVRNILYELINHSLKSDTSLQEEEKSRNLTPAMKALMEKITPEFDREKIHCGIDIIPTRWHLRLIFSKDSEYSESNFHFDKKGQCKSHEYGKVSSSGFKRIVEEILSKFS